MYPAITLTTSEALPSTSGSGEPERLTTLRRQLALAEGRVREQIAALDAVSWRFDRFYDGTFGYLGGFGGGYPADRADDRTHAALPYLTEEEWRLHLSLVREMAQRNHLLIGFRDHVKAFIGPVSVQFVLRGQAPGSTASGPVDADGDGQTDVDPLVRTVQEAWDEWCEVNDWGQGETDREEECIGRSILEGEATLEFFRGGRGEVPVCRHVEPELIRTPDEVPREFDWAHLEDWKWGALTKPHDAETVPAIYVAHPDRDGGRVIPANRFVRTKHNVDRVVKRGMSDFLPVAELVRKVSGLLENMGHVARLQAAIAWWEEYANTTEDILRRHIETNRDYQGLRLGGMGQGSNARTVDVKNYDPGSIIRTEAGRNVQVGPTSQPNGFVQVEQAIMRSISFRFGLPSSFSGEADSFASSLVSGSPFVRIIEGRQKKQQGFTRAVVERVILLCEESGRLPQGTWRRVKPVLTSKPVVIADEEKKARTFLSLLDKGVADPYKWMSAAGDDPKVLLANLASHRKKLAEMGGAPGPSDSGAGGLGAGPTDPAPAPPGSAGGDGSSPNNPDADTGDDSGLMGDVTREALSLFGVGNASEGVTRVTEIGDPPWPGAVFDRGRHRWVNPRRNRTGVNPNRGHKIAAKGALSKIPDAKKVAAVKNVAQKAGAHPKGKDILSRAGAWADAQAAKHADQVAAKLKVSPVLAKHILANAIKSLAAKALKNGGTASMTLDTSASLGGGKVNLAVNLKKIPGAGTGGPTTSIPGHDTWRQKMPAPEKVTGKPKTKKGRQELSRAVSNAWTEARNALAQKYGTRDINDLMSPAERKAEFDVFGAIEPLTTGKERDGPHDLGPISDARYAGYYRGAVQAVDRLRALAAQPANKRESRSLFTEILVAKQVTVHRSDGRTFQRQQMVRADADVTADRVHELHDDDKASILAGVDKAIAAIPEGQKPAEGVIARAKDLALAAAVKVYEWSVRLSPAAEKLGSLIGAILDTPKDMRQLGYNPNLSSGTANPKVADPVSAGLNDALGFGISGHIVASIASTVLVKAAYWASHKVRGESADTNDGVHEWAVMISDLLSHLNEQMGVQGGAPDAETVERNLWELLTAQA